MACTKSIVFTEQVGGLVLNNSVEHCERLFSYQTEDFSTTFEGPFELTAAGTALPLTWNVTAGVLPIGMSLSAIGFLSGTPTEQFDDTNWAPALGIENLIGSKLYIYTVHATDGFTVGDQTISHRCWLNVRAQGTYTLPAGFNQFEFWVSSPFDRYIRYYGPNLCASDRLQAFDGVFGNVATLGNVLPGGSGVTWEINRGPGLSAVDFGAGLWEIHLVLNVTNGTNSGWLFYKSPQAALYGVHVLTPWFYHPIIGGAIALTGTATVTIS